MIKSVEFIYILIYLTNGLFTVGLVFSKTVKELEKYSTGNKNLDYLRDGFIITGIFFLWPILLTFICYSWIQIKRGKINA